MQLTVAVTGAGGFIGSHLVETLVGAGHRVRALARYNARSSAGWLDELDSDVLDAVDVRFGDVRDPASVRTLLDGVDAACHLAALVTVPYSYELPASYVQTNVVGTHNVLDVARQLGTPRVVCASCGEVYGTARTVPMAEDHPLEARSPYAATKVAADKLAESYHLSFGLPVVVLRPFNTYGPRQSSRAVIPTIISQLAAGQERIAIGSLTPTRDFSFVADITRAFLAAVTGPDAMLGRVYNAGSGREISVEAVAHLIAGIMGSRVELAPEARRTRPAASEIHRLHADSSALQAVTSWRPEHTLEEGLAATVAWICRPGNLRYYDLHRYSI